MIGARSVARAGLLALAAFAAVGLLVATTPFGLRAAAQTGAPVASATRGATLFSDLGCASCHGARAEGGRAPRLAGTSTARGAFIQLVRSPVGVMPPYAADVATDADLAAIYVYLREVD